MPATPFATVPGTAPGGLTPREDQILELVGDGMTNREIGDRLGIAEKTVKNCMTLILAKLGLHRRSQAAVFVTVRRVSEGRPVRLA
jgi:DNA-binding NarL/FixJ family response regulator